MFFNKIKDSVKRESFGESKSKKLMGFSFMLFLKDEVKFDFVVERLTDKGYELNVGSDSVEFNGLTISYVDDFKLDEATLISEAIVGDYDYSCALMVTFVGEVDIYEQIKNCNVAYKIFSDLIEYGYAIYDDSFAYIVRDLSFLNSWLNAEKSPNYFSKNVFLDFQMMGSSIYFSGLTKFGLNNVYMDVNKVHDRLTTIFYLNYFCEWLIFHEFEYDVWVEEEIYGVMIYSKITTTDKGDVILLSTRKANVKNSDQAFSAIIANANSFKLPECNRIFDLNFCKDNILAIYNVFKSKLDPQDFAEDFGLRVRFEKGEEVEFLLLTEIEFENGLFKGKFMNDLEAFNFKAGEEIEFSVDSVINCYLADDVYDSHKLISLLSVDDLVK